MKYVWATISNTNDNNECDDDDDAEDDDDYMILMVMLMSIVTMMVWYWESGSFKLDKHVIWQLYLFLIHKHQCDIDVTHSTYHEMIA